MADSPAVSYEPTCHPGTREVVTGRIMAWARDPRAEPILWLSGPAGAGKSCIQRTIAQSCIAEGLFIACFFFSIKQSERNNETRFVTTLAAQLAENISGLKKHINSAIEMDHRIFTRSLESQVDGLIFKPLRALQGSILHRLKAFFNAALGGFFRAFCYQAHLETLRPNVIVVDGLDECIGEQEQARILRLIHALAANPHFPFRIIIASRPEYTIRTAFFSPSLAKDTVIFRLEQYEADGDLKLFLEAEFHHLKLFHPTSKAIPVDWPSPEDENALVTKASRQFIYVSVVMKHLANPRRNPMVELRRILDYQPSDSDTNPFTELDALYNRILHPPDINTFLLKSILHSVIHDKPTAMPLVGDLDVLFGLKPGTTSSTLVDLHSLLNFESPDRRPTFHHKSLEDFLTTPERGGDLYQSNDETHVELTISYYNLVQQHRLQSRGTTTSDHVWDLTLVTTHHACSVGDWSLFEREFAENTLPDLINSLVQNDIMAVTVLMERRRLDPYVHRYHSFFCTTPEDGCLQHCKEIRQLNMHMLPANLQRSIVDPPSMIDMPLDTASKPPGCGCIKFTNLEEHNRGVGIGPIQTP
ncbi:hypothetical protein MD484_g461, partial [Candolleomyces efflorescens]